MVNNNKNIYQWSIGKTVEEIDKMIEELQVAMDITRSSSILKNKRQIIKANTKAIEFLKSDRMMKSLMNYLDCGRSE